MGVEAWLVHLLFLDDPINRTDPQETWKIRLVQVDQEMELSGVDLPRVGHVFLPARDELKPSA